MIFVFGTFVIVSARPDPSPQNIVTAQSSQFFARNYNTLAAPLVAPAGSVVAPNYDSAAVAAPLALAAPVAVSASLVYAAPLAATATLSVPQPYPVRNAVDVSARIANAPVAPAIQAVRTVSLPTPPKINSASKETEVESLQLRHRPTELESGVSAKQTKSSSVEFLPAKVTELARTANAAAPAAIANNVVAVAPPVAGVVPVAYKSATIVSPYVLSPHASSAYSTSNYLKFANEV